MSIFTTIPIAKAKPRTLLHRLCPFMDDLQNANAQSLKADFIACLSVAPVAIPQAMGYAVIAGLPPQYGLYAMTFAVMLASLFGSSRYLVAGPTNAISIVLFTTIASTTINGLNLFTLPLEEKLLYVFALAFLVGIIQIFMGIVKFGSLANYISKAVMTGFTTGAALLIFSGQLKNIFQIDIASANFFQSFIEVFKHITQINYYSLGLGILAIIVIIMSKRVSKLIPAYLTAITVTAFAAYVFNLQEENIVFVSSIPATLQPLSMPTSFDFAILRELFSPALAIAMLGIVETITIGKNLASLKEHDHFNANQEMIGQGIGNIAASFTSGIPGCGSFSRSSLNFAAGAVSRFAALFSGLITIPVILFLAPLAKYIPMPALAGTLMYIAWNMIELDSIKNCLKLTKADSLVFLLTVTCCLLIDLEKAVFVGVITSLTLLVHKQATPRIKRINKDALNLSELKWVKNYPQFEIIYIEGTLFFGAAAHLEKYIQDNELQASVILLNLDRVFWIDATGVHCIEQLLNKCKKSNIKLHIVSSEQTVREVLERSQRFTDSEKNIIFDSLESALEHIKIDFNEL